MKYTHQLSKAILESRNIQMRGIRKAERAQYRDLKVGTALFLLFVATLFILS